MPVPDLVRPAAAVSTELTVPVMDDATLISGVVPARLMTPLLRLPEALKVMPLVLTVPLTTAAREAVLKTAVSVKPFVESHGVPETPVQLVAELSHVPVVTPDQVPVAAMADSVARVKAMSASNGRRFRYFTGLAGWIG